MNNKLLILFMLVGIFTIFITVANANGLFYTKNNDIIVTLRNDTDINKAKDIISSISGIKIVNIKSRDKEWSKMVNKMDLPNMENPFKNEFTIRTKKNANIDDIFNKIKEKSFVENIKYVSDTETK